MAQIRLMYWNIENFGQQSMDDYGPELLDLIVAVVKKHKVHLLAMNELRTNAGAAVGAGLVARLSVGAVHWAMNASPQFGGDRNEQYLFAWDTSVLINTNFQFDFPDAAKPGKFIGFPNQKTSDRPPYLGYFNEAAAPYRKLRICAFHAPNNDYWPKVRDGNRALGRVSEFSGDHVCVVMGDCNIRISANVHVVNTLGYEAFSPLCAIAPGFAQAGCSAVAEPALTSLIARNQDWIGMTIADCYSEPYDQMFVRQNPGVVINLATRCELIAACMTGQYLETNLIAVTQKVRGGAPLTYATVEDVFDDFRDLVTDHMPVLLDLSF